MRRFDGRSELQTKQSGLRQKPVIGELAHLWLCCTIIPLFRGPKSSLLLQVVVWGAKIEGDFVA